MTALIDADPLVYVIGWQYRDQLPDLMSIRDVQNSCDAMISQLLTRVRADRYVGSFSSEKSFRNRIYKYNPYKGSRRDKEQWVLNWEEVIKDHLRDKWFFVTPYDLEADDLLATAAAILLPPYIVCSPDKDMRQIPGLHFNPGKEDAVPVQITSEEADYAFWLQVLMGDDTDCVAGIPGIGEVKAKKILEQAYDPMMRPNVVRSAYVKNFGPYYGREIWEQTVDTIQLLCPSHSHWLYYGKNLMELIKSSAHPFKDTVESPFGS